MHTLLRGLCLVELRLLGEVVLGLLEPSNLGNELHLLRSLDDGEERGLPVT